MALLWHIPYFLRFSVDSVLLLSNHQMQKKDKANIDNRKGIMTNITSYICSSFEFAFSLSEDKISFFSLVNRFIIY